MPKGGKHPPRRKIAIIERTMINIEPLIAVFLISERIIKALMNINIPIILDIVIDYILKT